MEQEDAAEIEILTLRHVGEIVSVMEASRERAEFPIGGLWDKSSLKQEIEIGQGLALRVDGFGLAAFALFRVYDHHREITVLATHPDRRRKGDMKFLLSYMLERRSPSERIWLEVHAGNLAAISLYEGLGFANVGQRAKYYRDGGDAIMFTLA